MWTSSSCPVIWQPRSRNWPNNINIFITGILSIWLKLTWDIIKILIFLYNSLPPSPPKAFSTSDISSVIDSLPKKKELGYDLITSEILEKYIILFTYIYYSVLRTTYFPTLWKMVPSENGSQTLKTYSPALIL